MGLDNGSDERGCESDTGTMRPSNAMQPEAVSNPGARTETQEPLHLRIEGHSNGCRPKMGFK